MVLKSIPERGWRSEAAGGSRYCGPGLDTKDRGTSQESCDRGQRLRDAATAWQGLHQFPPDSVP